MLDLGGRLVVIIGGGNVAARKAEGLLAAGALRVKVVAPEIAGAMPMGVERVVENYTPEHLEGAGLVFAATNVPAVNAAVVRDAHARGLLVQRADEAQEDGGDFSTPALWRDQDLAVTVSAGGHPTLAAAIRDQLQQQIDPRWKTMAQAMRVLRPRAQSTLANEAARRAVLREMAGHEAMDVLEREGIEGLWAWLLKKQGRNA
jgi:siroheme synthase-like protein